MGEIANSEKVNETTEPKNIYAKMASVKSKLIGLKKGGKNDYSGYSYFELGDILPVLTPALEENRLYMKTQFSATEQVAKLIVVDIDNPESTIDFEIRFAECALKGAHEIQNLGAAQTYTRRYLIMTAFDIAEADMVDAGAEKDEKKEAQKKAKKPPAQKWTPPAKPTPQPQTPPQEAQEESLTQLRRSVWELIKKLPTDDQVKWINQCKDADGQTLKKIYVEVNAILNAPQTPQGKQNEGQRLAEQAANPETAPKDEIKPDELEIY